jgi:lipoprotein-releasing system permease protein
MTVRSSFLLALRLLFPRTEKTSSARRSLRGAVFCIGISLVPLVVVMTVSNGMIQGITERIIGLSSSHIEAILYSGVEEASSAASLDSFSRQLQREKGVVRAYAELQGLGLATGKKSRTGALIRAVDRDIFQKNPAYRALFTVISGSADISSAPDCAVLGEKIAENLGIRTGDSFRIITTRVLPSGTVIPRISVFKVAGIVSCGYQELDALWIFIPLERGFDIFSPESSSASIKLETNTPFSSDLLRLQSNIQVQAGTRARVYRWNELNTDEYENFASTKMMLMFIMLLIVFVAVVNIFSALVMLAMERRREIAILKSIGGSRQGITLSFLITGFAAGFGGIITGLPLGLVVAVNINKIILFVEKTVNFTAKIMYLLEDTTGQEFIKIHILDPAYYLQVIPVYIPFRELFIAGAGTLLLSLAASAIPAVRAGNEKPLETLRKI